MTPEEEQRQELLELARDEMRRQDRNNAILTTVFVLLALGALGVLGYVWWIR